MLKSLLDEQISPVIAQQITIKRPEIDVFSLHNWEVGRFLDKADEVILEMATRAGLTLVSYDQNTIPPILSEWAEMGINHCGVIFVDYQSIKPSDFGRLVRSLIWLWDHQKQDQWENRVIYLNPK